MRSATNTTGEFITTEVSEGRMNNLRAMNILENSDKRDRFFTAKSRVFNWLAVVAVIAVLFLPFLVYAQDGGTSPVGDTVAATPPIDAHKLIADIIFAIAGVLVTVVTAVVIPAFRKWAQSKADSAEATAVTKTLISVGLKVEGFVFAGLTKVWHVFEAEMKAATLPSSDGGSKVTEAELTAARERVLAEVKNYLGTAGLEELKGVFGFGGELLDNFLRAKIDEKIQEAKEAGSVAAASVDSGHRAANILGSL